MQIGKFDGTVTFSRGSIQRTMDKAAFLSSALGKDAERSSANEPYESFDFVPEPGVMATIAFHGDRLLNLSITFDLPDDDPANRSVQREMTRKKVHDEFLRKELGKPPYRYAWGAVDSDFYHQHCASEIICTYGHG